jgi:hypothetical protein
MCVFARFGERYAYCGYVAAADRGRERVTIAVPVGPGGTEELPQALRDVEPSWSCLRLGRT